MYPQPRSAALPRQAPPPSLHEYQLHKIRDWAKQTGKDAQAPTRLYWRVLPKLDGCVDFLTDKTEFQFYFRLQTFPLLPEGLVGELQERGERLSLGETLEYPQC